MSQDEFQEKFYELYHILAHTDSAFIQQHIVEAFARRIRTKITKPVAIAFALMELSLYLERTTPASKFSWPIWRLHNVSGAAEVRCRN
jgi:hypothetical protein